MSLYEKDAIIDRAKERRKENRLFLLESLP